MLVEITPEFLDSFVDFYTDGDEIFKKELEIVFKYKKNYFHTYEILSLVLNENFSSNFLDNKTLRMKKIELSKKLLELMHTAKYDFVDEEISCSSDFNIENIQKASIDVFGKDIGFNRVSHTISQELFESLQRVFLVVKIEKHMDFDVDIKDLIKENKILREKLDSLQHMIFKKDSEVREFLYTQNEEIIEFLKDVPKEKFLF